MTAFFIYRAEEKVPLEKTNGHIKEEPARIDPIVQKVSGMSLDEKIWQLLIVGFEHVYPDDHIQKMITEYHIGGINLLGRNVQGKIQVQKLISDLQGIADIPLFITTDQEGGDVVRFTFFDELTPQFRITSTSQAELVALHRALELRELGVNMNFSPVMDYVSNSRSYLYSRTFGTNPDAIGELGRAMVKGYKMGGVIPVAKHFPGYGNIVYDPHRNQAVSVIHGEELKQNLAPFKKIVEDNSAVAIMTAHIVVPSVDAKPATLSSKFLSSILRKELGFEGVIITDDMEMAAVGHPIEQVSADAINAGADIIISTYTPEKQIRIFNHLKKTVRTGEIKEERINESVIRILNLKSMIGRINK